MVSIFHFLNQLPLMLLADAAVQAGPLLTYSSSPSDIPCIESDLENYDSNDEDVVDCDEDSNYTPRKSSANSSKKTAKHVLKCPYQGCDSHFKKPWGVKRHIQTVHQRTKTCFCGTCGKPYGRLDTMKKHESTCKRFTIKQKSDFIFVLNQLKR